MVQNHAGRWRTLQKGAKTFEKPPHSHFLHCKYSFYTEKGLVLGSSALGLSISRLLILLCPTAKVFEKNEFSDCDASVKKLSSIYLRRFQPLALSSI